MPQALRRAEKPPWISAAAERAQARAASASGQTCAAIAQILDVPSRSQTTVAPS